MTTEVFADTAPRSRRTPVLGYALAAVVSACVWGLLLVSLL